MIVNYYHKYVYKYDKYTHIFNDVNFLRIAIYNIFCHKIYFTNFFRYSQHKLGRKCRVVLKNGDCNIYPFKTFTKLFVRDIFTTLVDLRWRWTCLIFAMGFFGSWIIFAISWWIIAFMHGDLESEHLPNHQLASNWTPCVLEIYDFTSCFLFSVETQHTTGYGLKSPTDECSSAIILMCVQNIIGLVIEAFLVGVVFAKLTRPKLRTQTIIFSKFAVICKRENVLYLMFRIGDVRRKSRIIETKIKAQLIQSKKTAEGEYLKYHQTKLVVSADDCGDDLFFIWPMTIIHKIDEVSPLYHLSAKELLTANFEIVVTLEGTIESTDQKTQARTSFLADEILWGHRFEQTIHEDEAHQGYKIDYDKFDETFMVDTPLCSAAHLTDLSNLLQSKF